MNTHKIIYVVLFALLANTVYTQNHLQWRGINRTGHFMVDNTVEKWPETGPELLLMVDSLPNSYSSVVLKNDVLFTTGIIDEEEYLTAINMDGSIKWNTNYGKAWDNSYPNGRSTPTIVNDKAYVISGYGHIACVDLELGKMDWNFDAYTKYGGKCGKWGVAESPLVVDDKLFYTPCGDQTTMVAIDRHTGETLWQSKSLNDYSGYVSPVLMEIGGKQLIVTVTSKYVVAFNAADGFLMWQFNYFDIDKPFMGGDINPVTPLVKGNDIFVTSGYNHVGIMLTVSDDLKSVSEKWRSAALDVHHGGVVEYNGFIYGSNYTSLRNGNWICLDWNTGEVKYDVEWQGKGSIILVDDKLICYEERRGNIALVKADPSGFNIISEFTVPYGKGPHWSHLSVYNNKLLVRHGETLMVYNFSEKSTALKK